MPRDASGNYVLPAGNPVVAGTAASATAFNNTMEDFRAELQDSLSRSGKGAMTAPLKGVNGGPESPSFTFESDTNTGIYRSDVDEVALAAGGQLAAKANPNGLIVPAGKTITSTQAAKAWGTLEIGAAGAVTVLGGFNISSATFSGADLTVTMTDALPSAVYTVFATLQAGNRSVYLDGTKTTTQFVLHQQDLAGAAANWALNQVVGVLVFGVNLV